MKTTFASANLQTKVAILAARCCGIWGLLVLAYLVEPRGRSEFPLGASFFVLTCALVPSAVLGI